MTAVAEQRRTSTRVTVELEPELAEGLAKIAEARSTSVEQLLTAAVEQFLDEDKAGAFDLTPEQAAECYEGIAAIERGEGVPNEEVFAKIKAKHGW